jgi:hypothetical protein
MGCNIYRRNKEAASVVIVSGELFMSCYKYVNGVFEYEATNNFDFYAFCYKAALITKTTCGMICCSNENHYSLLQKPITELAVFLQVL